MDKYSHIKVNENIGVFIYFFVIMFLLGLIGGHYPKLAEPISIIMQEHIAGKSILVFVGPLMLLGFLCSLRKPSKEVVYGAKRLLFIVNPSNFLITLCFVAAAINWAITLSAKISFPYIAKGEVFKHMVASSIEISLITILTTLVLWVYHIKLTEFADDSTKKELLRMLFIAVVIISIIFWVAFFGQIINLAINA